MAKSGGGLPPDVGYHECFILCPARLPQVCMVNLYKELRQPGSTPVRASVWFSRWQYHDAHRVAPKVPLPGQLELPFGE